MKRPGLGYKSNRIRVQIDQNRVQIESGTKCPEYESSCTLNIPQGSNKLEVLHFNQGVKNIRNGYIIPAQ